MYLFENENQNRGSVQVFFNPVGSEKGRESREYSFLLFAFF
jgi:hypothetical protein